MTGNPSDPETRGSSTQPSVRVTLAIGVAAAIVALTFLVLRLVAPGDRTELVLDATAAGGPGMEIQVVGTVDGLRNGDLVVAIDGVSPADLLSGASAPAPADPTGATRTYTVVQDGATATFPVMYQRLPPVSALAADAPFYLFLLYLAGAGIVVFARRPDLLSARLFFCLCAAIASAELIWALSFSASDLLRGPFVLAFTAANAILFFLALSCGLHFALVFPSPLPLLARRPTRLLAAVYGGPWLLYGLGILGALVMGGDALALLLRHWQLTSYVGGAVFLAVIAGMVAQWLRHPVSAERRQLTWLVWGVTVAFLPWVALLLVTLITPLSVRGAVSWASIFFLAIPTSVAIAIVRERLFDIDLIVNRTVLYASLTAVLAGVYAAAVGLTQRALVALTGEQSDLAIVLATLIVVVTFSPAKDLLQRAIDRRFKGGPPSVLRLRTFQDQVRARIATVDPEQVTRRLLAETVDALQLTGGSATLVPDRSSPAAVAGAWPVPVSTVVPLLAENGTQLGTLELGERRDGSRLDPAELAACREAARVVATAIAVDTGLGTAEEGAPVIADAVNEA